VTSDAPRLPDPEGPYEEALDLLYSLNRKQLRRLAWEAVLISDGPNRMEGDVDNAAVLVHVHSDSFKLYCPEDLREMKDLRKPRIKEKRVSGNG